MACTFLRRKKDRPRCKRPSHPKILYKVRRNVSEAVPARFFVPCTERRTPWQTTNFCSPRRSTPTTITTPRKFRSSRDWKRCASVRVCISVRQAPRDCIIWKNRTVSAPWATACQLSLRTSPGCLTLQNGNQFCWFGVCSISMNGLLPPMPRIRSWHMAVKLGGVSMPG